MTSSNTTTTHQNHEDHMPPTYSLFVPGNPVPQGSKRHVGNGRLIESAKTLAPWRATIRQALETTIPDPLDGPIAARVAFVMPRPKSTAKTRPTPAAVKRPDVDKLLRAVLDAGTGAAWHDDSQVVDVDLTKRIAELGEQPGVHLAIAAMTPAAEPEAGGVLRADITTVDELRRRVRVQAFLFGPPALVNPNIASEIA